MKIARVSADATLLLNWHWLSLFGSFSFCSLFKDWSIWGVSILLGFFGFVFLFFIFLLFCFLILFPHFWVLSFLSLVVYTESTNWVVNGDLALSSSCQISTLAHFPLSLKNLKGVIQFHDLGIFSAFTLNILCCFSVFSVILQNCVLVYW